MPSFTNKWQIAVKILEKLRDRYCEFVECDEILDELAVEPLDEEDGSESAKAFRDQMDEISDGYGEVDILLQRAIDSAKEAEVRDE